MRRLKAYASPGDINAELKYKAEQFKEFCSDVNNETALSIREVRRDECRAKI